MGAFCCKIKKNNFILKKFPYTHREIENLKKKYEIERGSYWYESIETKYIWNNVYEI